MNEKLKKWYYAIRWFFIGPWCSFKLKRKNTGKRTVKYGLFGISKVEYDRHGLTERLVIFQESGLFVGAPPSELRIHCFVPFDEIDFGRQWCAYLNRNTDLPFYLGRVKIKTVTIGDKVTDADLPKYELEPLTNAP